MPTNLECSGPEAIDRSGSFQRKHLEEHDGSKYRSSGSYELSSDIRDRQVEAIRVSCVFLIFSLHFGFSALRNAIPLLKKGLTLPAQL